MTQIIKTKLFAILLTVLDMLASKKFLAAIAGAVASYEATGDSWVIVYATLAYIASQGVADFGKEAAKVDRG